MLGGVLISARADTFTLTDGNVLNGDMIKFDDSGIMLREPGEVYTNISWMMLSQDTLKQLAQNPKVNRIIAPLLEPAPKARPAKPAIVIHDVDRLKTPPPSSVLGGFFSSSIGILMGLLIYAGNLYAGYEVAVCRNRPLGTVILLSAIVPVIGPTIFALLPIQTATNESEEDAAGPESAAAPAPGDGQTSAAAAEAEALPDATTVAAEQPRKQQTQVFQRGKFMFNKRFIETKFSLFLKGASPDFVLVIITPKGQYIVNRIGEVTPAEMQIFTDDGQAAIPYGEIQEAHIKPRSK